MSVNFFYKDQKVEKFKARFHIIIIIIQVENIRFMSKIFFIINSSVFYKIHHNLENLQLFSS